MFVFVLFFTQKTAYEMRISDWSSDVCSSDLEKPGTAFWHIEFDRVKPGSSTARSQALRRALSLAIDRDALNEIVGFSGPAAGSPIPPGEIGRAACRARVCQYV